MPLLQRADGEESCREQSHNRVCCYARPIPSCCNGIADEDFFESVYRHCRVACFDPRHRRNFSLTSKLCVTKLAVGNDSWAFKAKKSPAAR